MTLSPYSQPPRRGTRELVASYREMPWLRAVTQRIARGVSTATWHLYAQARPGEKAQKSNALAYGDRETRERTMKMLRSTGGLRELEDHPLLTLLACPNPTMTGRAAFQVSQTHIDLKGESYWLLERSPLGMPVRYWPLPPHWVLDCPTAARNTYRIGGMGGGATFEVPASDIIPLRDIDPEQPYGRGTGVAEALGDELEISEYASKHIKSFFYNRALPHALVSFENAKEASVKEQSEKWNRENQGFMNAFRTYFTGSKIQVERLDTTFQDQQLNELRKWQHDLIREVFAMPPEILGVIENSNRSTIDAAQFIFATGVLVPRLEFLRTELQARLVPLFDDRLVLDYDTPVPEAREFQLQAVRAIPEAFQLNEIRAIAGLEGLAELEGVFAHHASGAQSNAEGEPPKPSLSPSHPKPETPPGGKRLGFEASAATDPPWVNTLSRR